MYGKDIARGKDPGNKSRRRDIICKTGIQTGKDPGNVKWTDRSCRKEQCLDKEADFRDSNRKSDTPFQDQDI